MSDRKDWPPVKDNRYIFSNGISLTVTNGICEYSTSNFEDYFGTETFK